MRCLFLLSLQLTATGPSCCGERFKGEMGLQRPWGPRFDVGNTAIPSALTAPAIGRFSGRRLRREKIKAGGAHWERDRGNKARVKRY